MSLQKLLANYPNYPARRIRRLAAQLEWLECQGIDPITKGIAHDLMQLNLLEADGRVSQEIVADQTPTGVKIDIFAENGAQPLLSPVRVVALDEVLKLLDLVAGDPMSHVIAKSEANAHSFMSFYEATHENGDLPAPGPAG